MKLFKHFGCRVAVLLLCISMLTGMLLPAQAASTYDPTAKTPDPTPAASFKFSNGTITDHIGEETDIVIPAKIDGKEVTKLDNMCIGGSNAAVKTIVIPSTVVYYGDYLFDYMYSVTDLYFYGDVPANFANSLANSIIDGSISDSMLTVHCKDEYLNAFEEAVDGAVTVLGDINADFASTLTYEDSEICKYYISAEGKTEVSPAILISWNSGTGTPEDIVKGAYISGNFRFAYGISQEQYDSQNVSGKRLASQVATLTVTHPERVVLNVYEQAEGGEAKLVKGYTPSELAALKTEGKTGYQFWNKSGSEQLIAATEYVTVSSLLADAGITFANGDTLTAAAADGFSTSLTYADSETLKYYITADGKTEVPAALALTWGSGAGTLDDIAATAKNTGNIRFVYGISEQQYADKSAEGKRLVSKIATVTVIHCGHTDTELRNAKAATCAEDGYTGDLYCKTCGKLLEAGKTVDALGHNYENGICTVCGAKDPDAWANLFKDVKETDWFFDGVKFANQNGLFKGTEVDTFSPEDAMTRAMLVTVLWRLDGQPVPSTLTTLFVDVPVTTGKNVYYAEAVAWAAENGIINGVDTNHFAPDDEVTREQIAAIVFRYAAKKGVGTTDRADLTIFPDADQVSGYAKEALAWANTAELVKGSKEGRQILLMPQGSATRAQVAVILSRYVETIAK